MLLNLWQSLTALAGIAIVLVVIWVIQLHQDGKPGPTWNK